MGTRDLHRIRRLVFTQNPVNLVAGRSVLQRHSEATQSALVLAVEPEMSLRWLCSD